MPDPCFEEVKEYVRSGVFGSNSYDELLGSLEGNEGFGRADYFLVGKDFPSYVECQEQVDQAYRDQQVRSSTSNFILSNSCVLTVIEQDKRYAQEFDILPDLCLIVMCRNGQECQS